MNEYKLKEQMCEIGRRVYAKGFAAANDGNITVRLNEREFLCTPTMVSKGFMKPEDICKVDLEGKQLAGTRKRTSEVLLHLAIYKQRPTSRPCVHCHPPHATAFAVAHEPIPKCVLPGGRGVPRRGAHRRLRDARRPEIRRHRRCPSSRTATRSSWPTTARVTFGPDLEKAYWNTEIIDAYCRILILSRSSGGSTTSATGRPRELLALKKRLGYDDVRFRDEDCHRVRRQQLR